MVYRMAARQRQLGPDAAVQRKPIASPASTTLPPRSQPNPGYFADTPGSAPGLPEGLQNRLEHLSQLPMGDIRVHYNSSEPARVQAHAFTKGPEIHLAPGQEHQLGHEAWHAAQQKQGRVQPGFRSLGVAINDAPGLEAEADRMGARLQAGQDPGPPAGGMAAPAPAPSPVVQRVVTIGGQLLGRAADIPGFAQMSPLQQQTLAQMVDDRATLHAYPSLQAVYQHLVGGDASAAPVSSAIPTADLEQARRKKRHDHFERQTERESTLAKHEAFDLIPQKQLYRLGDKRWWVRNPITKQWERRRRRGEAALSGEQLIEYVDPKDSKRENYGYLRGRQVITSRTDPSSTAGLSRSGASGSKILYKDARGSLISKRKFVGENNNEAIQPFKRKRDKQTFTIGHSVAVKNMSLAKDPQGLNSDEQPQMMVPENRTVGEQMKNPALEPENRPYVWNNFYTSTPDTTFSGHPIPSHTQAAIFKPGGNDLDFNVELVNDGSIVYKDEREKERKGRTDYSYKQYMLEHAQKAFEAPPFFDFEQEPPTSPLPDPPQTPYFLPDVWEEQEVSSTTELSSGTTYQHLGEDWQVGWTTGKTSTGEFGYKIGRTDFYKPSTGDQQSATSFFAPPATTTIDTTPTDDPMTGTAQASSQTATPSTDLSTGLTDDDLGLLLSDPTLANLFADFADQLRKKEKETERQQAGFLSTGRRLQSAVPSSAQQLVATDLGAITQMLGEVEQLDPSGFMADSVVDTNFSQLYQLFRRIEPVLQRPVTQSGGDALSAAGSRLPVLAQFFAECGQMAAHNVLALANPANLASYQHLQNALNDETTLRGLGNFANQIHEDNIRQLLLGGGRQDLPVIGNIGQIEGQLAADDNALQQVWNLGAAQLAELGTLRDFMTGQTNEINLVVNTEAATPLGAGHHWITVRVERAADGTRLYYADSLNGPADYSGLFARLKQMLGL
jgi:Domain of unknown function (DUF4157)